MIVTLSCSPPVGDLRLVIADDHAVFVDALSARLDAEPGFSVVGTATTAAKAEALILELVPDIALLDVEFGDGDGIDIADRLRDKVPETSILIMTAHDDPATASAAALAGAAAFLPKDATGQELLDAIGSALRGETWIRPLLLRKVFSELAQRKPAQTGEQEKLSRMTDREWEVFRCMVRGYARSAIARELYLSTNTVRTHVRNLLAKLEVHSSLEAVALGLRAGVCAEGGGSAKLAPGRPKRSERSLGSHSH